MMQAMIVKQLLLAAGVNDPQVMKTIDAVMGGSGWGLPSVEPLPVREGADAIRICAQNREQKLTLILLTEKVLDTGKFLPDAGQVVCKTLQAAASDNTSYV